jgi:hypothetical protein
MEEVYRLFGRRCRMATALAELAKPRAIAVRPATVIAEHSVGAGTGEDAGVPG